MVLVVCVFSKHSMYSVNRIFHDWKCLYSTCGGHSQCLYLIAHKINQALKKTKQNQKTSMVNCAFGWTAEYHQKLNSENSQCTTLNNWDYFIYLCEPVIPLNKFTECQHDSFIHTFIQDTALGHKICTFPLRQHLHWLHRSEGNLTELCTGFLMLKCCYLLILMFYTNICTCYYAAQQQHLQTSGFHCSTVAPTAEALCHHYILLVLSGQCRGTVWVWHKVEDGWCV